MAEIILGVGQQDSARKVAAIAEEQLRDTQGIPKTLVAHAGAWHIAAKRPDFEAEFDTFDLKVMADGQDADEREAADDADRADSEVGEDEEPEFEGAPDPDV